MHPPENLFLLKSSDKGFIERQKNAFGLLSSVPCNLHQPEKMDVDTVLPEHDRKSTRQFRGKESIFKRPEAPIRKSYMRTIPDFKKNPHKWKKYSLADVKDEDISDAANTKIALAFLNELKERCLEEKDTDLPQIQFKKRGSATEDSSSEEKPCFRNSKLVMPEYVVGQKRKKEKKSRSVEMGSNQLKLDHLYEED